MSGEEAFSKTELLVIKTTETLLSEQTFDLLRVLQKYCVRRKVLDDECSAAAAAPRILHPPSGELCCYCDQPGLQLSTRLREVPKEGPYLGLLLVDSARIA